MEKLLVINVLPAEPYNDCHIKGSINVPTAELEAYVQNVPKETNIVVYCASYMCPASRMAWKKLNEIGFENLWAYEGGTNEWFHAKLPTEGACSLEYLSTPVTKAEETQVREISATKLLAMMKEHGLE